ncbi:hypothetical protein LguiB_006148 [Lonicera macranthoides]
MADIKADTTSQHQHRLIVTEPEAPVAVEVENEEEKPRRQTKRQRVASVDIFRGFTVAKVLADLDIWILVEKSSHQKLFKSLSTKMSGNLDGLEEKLHWGGVEDEEDGTIFGEIMGINHMYEDPAWKRSKVSIE